MSDPELPESWDEDYRRLHLRCERERENKMRYRRALHAACCGCPKAIRAALDEADNDTPCGRSSAHGMVEASGSGVSGE